MGRLVNPGNILFTEDLNSNIYVDKSEMVVDLNEYYRTGDKYICVSRARRFGKTMMTNLLSAYYSKGCDSRALFEGLKLAQHEGWDKYLNSSNVIYIDMNGRYWRATDKKTVIKELRSSVIRELSIAFPTVQLRDVTHLSDALSNIYNQLGETFTIIIDEYDVVIRDPEASDGVQKEYIGLLNDLFKNNEVRNAIDLVYITGILPILKEMVQSKLNNFSEFTMLDPCQLAPYWGFTEEEVARLCKQFNMDTGKCRDMYDGYYYPEIGHIYNPNSVVKAMLSQKYNSYWAKTSKAEAITYYINANLDGIQEDITELLEGKEIDVNTNTYANDVREFTSKDDVFTYLIHLGYLAYDNDTEKCRIPNAEIRREWFSVMEKAKDLNVVYEICNTSSKLMKATENGDEQAVALALDDAHETICSPLTYNRESSMQSAILMAYLYAQRDYMVFSELTAGSGYADVAFVPLRSGKRAIIIELKKDGKPEDALNQILERNYAHALRRHPGKGAILVGISYNPEDKKHQCKIMMVEDVKEVWRN